MENPDKKYKKAYSKPELIIHGNVKDITKGDCKKTHDDFDLGCSGTV